MEPARMNNNLYIAELRSAINHLESELKEKEEEIVLQKDIVASLEESLREKRDEEERRMTEIAKLKEELAKRTTLEAQIEKLKIDAQKQVQEAVDNAVSIAPHIKQIFSTCLNKEVPAIVHSTAGLMLRKLETLAQETMKLKVKSSSTQPSQKTGGHISKGEEEKQLVPTGGITLKEPASQSQATHGADISTTAEDRGKKRKEIEEPEAGTDQSLKKLKGSGSDARAEKKRDLKEMVEVKSTRLNKNLCIQYSPRNPNERRALKFYAHHKTVMELIGEVTEHEVDSKERETTLEILDELMPRMTKEKNKEAYPKMIELLFNRDVVDKIAFMEKSTVKGVREYVPLDYMNEWMRAEERFIKMHYFWLVFKTRSAQEALVKFMERFHSNLWSVILEKAGDELFATPKQRFLQVKRMSNGKDVDVREIEK